MKFVKQLLVSMDYCCSTSLTSLSDSSSTSFQDMGLNNVFQIGDGANYDDILMTAQMNSPIAKQYPISSSFDSQILEDFRVTRQSVDKDNNSTRLHCIPINKKVSRTSRIMRNVAEKQRRDKLNSCISKLATLVPLVSLSNKRINKSGILRLAASYLRLHSGAINCFMKEHLGGCFPFLDKELSKLLLEMTEGFAIITNESLKILFASDLIESFLRHPVVDVLGQSFYTLIHPDDHSLLQDKILSTDLSSDNGNFSLFCSMMENNIDGKNRFNCKLMRIVGYKKTFKVNEDSKQDVGTIYIFIAKLCLVQPRNTIAWTTNPNEITFRSAFTGRCLFVDHKLSILLGIMPSEIEGFSGYDWICKEDHPLAAVAHTQMLNEGFYRGIPIRLLTSNKTAIYFMTAGKLVCSLDGGAVDLMYMVCTLISNEEGERIQALVRHRLANQLGSFAPHDFDSKLAEGDESITTSEKSVTTPPQPVKRPRGRPRKYPLSSTPALKLRRASVKENGVVRDSSVTD